VPLPQRRFAIPEQTRQVASAAFPNGSLCIRIADELGNIFLDEQFAPLFRNADGPQKHALFSPS
jgi:hypothetical protein